MTDDPKKNDRSPETVTTLRQEKVVCVNRNCQKEAEEKGEVVLPVISLEKFSVKDCPKNFQFGIKVAGGCKVQTELTATLRRTGTCTSSKTVIKDDVLIGTNGAGTEKELNKTDYGIPISSTGEKIIGQEREYIETDKEEKIIGGQKKENIETYMEKMAEKEQTNEQNELTQSQNKESLEDEKQPVKEKNESSDLPDMEEQKLQVMEGGMGEVVEEQGIIGKTKEEEKDKGGLPSESPAMKTTTGPAQQPQECGVLLLRPGCAQLQMEVSQNKNEIKLDLWLPSCTGECKKAPDSSKMLKREKIIETEDATRMVGEEKAIEGEIVTEAEDATKTMEEEMAIEGEVITEAEDATQTMGEEKAIEGEIVSEAEDATGTMGEEKGIEGEIVTEAEDATGTMGEEKAIEGEIVTEAEDATKITMEEEKAIEGEIVSEAEDAIGTMGEEKGIEGEIVTEAEDATGTMGEEKAIEGEIVTEAEDATKITMEEEKAIEGEIVTEAEDATKMMGEEKAIEGEIVTEAEDETKITMEEEKAIEGEIVIEAEDATKTMEEEKAIEGEIVTEAEYATKTMEVEKAIEGEIVTEAEDATRTMGEEKAIEGEIVTEAEDATKITMGEEKAIEGEIVTEAADATKTMEEEKAIEGEIVTEAEDATKTMGEEKAIEGEIVTEAEDATKTMGEEKTIEGEIVTEAADATKSMGEEKAFEGKIVTEAEDATRTLGEEKTIEGGIEKSTEAPKFVDSSQVDRESFGVRKADKIVDKEKFPVITCVASEGQIISHGETKYVVCPEFKDSSPANLDSSGGDVIIEAVAETDVESKEDNKKDEIVAQEAAGITPIIETEDNLKMEKISMGSIEKHTEAPEFTERSKMETSEDKETEEILDKEKTPVVTCVASEGQIISNGEAKYVVCPELKDSSPANLDSSGGDGIIEVLTETDMPIEEDSKKDEISMAEITQFIEVTEDNLNADLESINNIEKHTEPAELGDSSPANLESSGGEVLIKETEDVKETQVIKCVPKKGMVGTKTDVKYVLCDTSCISRPAPSSETGDLPKVLETVENNGIIEESTFTPLVKEDDLKPDEVKERDDIGEKVDSSVLKTDEIGGPEITQIIEVTEDNLNADSENINNIEKHTEPTELGDSSTPNLQSSGGDVIVEVETKTDIPSEEDGKKDEIAVAEITQILEVTEDNLNADLKSIDNIEKHTGPPQLGDSSPANLESSGDEVLIKETQVIKCVPKKGMVGTKTDVKYVLCDKSCISRPAPSSETGDLPKVLETVENNGIIEESTVTPLVKEDDLNPDEVKECDDIGEKVDSSVLEEVNRREEPAANKMEISGSEEHKEKSSEGEAKHEGHLSKEDMELKQQQVDDSPIDKSEPVPVVTIVSKDEEIIQDNQILTDSVNRNRSAQNAMVEKQEQTIKDSEVSKKCRGHCAADPRTECGIIRTGTKLSTSEIVELSMKESIPVTTNETEATKSEVSSQKAENEQVIVDPTFTKTSEVDMPMESEVEGAKVEEYATNTHKHSLATLENKQLAVEATQESPSKKISELSTGQPIENVQLPIAPTQESSSKNIFEPSTEQPIQGDLEGPALEHKTASDLSAAKIESEQHIVDHIEEVIESPVDQPFESKSDSADIGEHKRPVEEPELVTEKKEPSIKEGDKATIKAEIEKASADVKPGGENRLIMIGEGCAQVQMDVVESSCGKEIKLDIWLPSCIADCQKTPSTTTTPEERKALANKTIVAANDQSGEETYKKDNVAIPQPENKQLAQEMDIDTKIAKEIDTEHAKEIETEHGQKTDAGSKIAQTTDPEISQEIDTEPAKEIDKEVGEERNAQVTGTGVAQEIDTEPAKEIETKFAQKANTSSNIVQEIDTEHAEEIKTELGQKTDAGSKIAQITDTEVSQEIDTKPAQVDTGSKITEEIDTEPTQVDTGSKITQEIDTEPNQETDVKKDQPSSEKVETKLVESLVKIETEKCPDYVKRDSKSKATARKDDTEVCTGICATESDVEITPSMIEQALQDLSVITREKCQQSELRTLKSAEISKVLQYCLKVLECTGVCRRPTQSDALLGVEEEIKVDDKDRKITKAAPKVKSAREESEKGYSIANIRTRASSDSLVEIVMSWAGGNLSLVDIAIRKVSKTETELKVEAWTPVLASSKLLDTKTSNIGKEHDGTPQDSPSPGQFSEPSVLFAIIMDEDNSETRIKMESGKSKEDYKNFVFQYEDSVEINKSCTHAMQFHSSEADLDENNSFNTEVILTSPNTDNIQKVFGFQAGRSDNTVEEMLPVFKEGLGDQYEVPEYVPERAVLTNFNFNFQPKKRQIVSSEALFIECCKLGMKTTFIITLKEMSATGKINSSNPGQITHQIINNGVQSAPETNIIGPDKAPLSITVPLGTTGQGLMKVFSESNAVPLLTSPALHISTSDSAVTKSGTFYSAYVDGKEKSEVKNLLPGDAPLLIQMPFGRHQGILSCVTANQLPTSSSERPDRSGYMSKEFNAGRPEGENLPIEQYLNNIEQLESLDKPLAPTLLETKEKSKSKVSVDSGDSGRVCQCRTAPENCDCQTKPADLKTKSQDEPKSSPDKPVVLTEEQLLAEMLKPDDYPPPVEMIVPLKYDDEEQKPLAKPPSRFGNMNKNFVKNMSKFTEITDDNLKTIPEDLIQEDITEITDNNLKTIPEDIIQEDRVEKKSNSVVYTEKTAMDTPSAPPDTPGAIQVPPNKSATVPAESDTKNLDVQHTQTAEIETCGNLTQDARTEKGCTCESLFDNQPQQNLSGDETEKKLSNQEVTQSGGKTIPNDIVMDNMQSGDPKEETPLIQNVATLEESENLPGSDHLIQENNLEKESNSVEKTITETSSPPPAPAGDMEVPPVPEESDPKNLDVQLSQTAEIEKCQDFTQDARLEQACECDTLFKQNLTGDETEKKLSNQESSKNEEETPLIRNKSTLEANEDPERVVNLCQCSKRKN